MYHVVLNNTFRFTSWFSGVSGIYHKSRTEVELSQHLTNVLPSLFAVQRQCEMIAKKSFDPIRGNDGGCRHIDVMVVFAMEVSDDQAVQIQAEWDRLADEKDAYEDELVLNRQVAAAYEQAVAQNKIDNRWYNKLFRTTTFYTGDQQ